MKQKTQRSRCIFHVPFPLKDDLFSGSSVRPIRILNAFKKIGYEVEVVSGYGEERKKNIKRIKEEIKQGIKFDFLYSESSTMPTTLTEKRHFPVYPFLDYSFFSYCRRRRIPIGLFYRDIYWRFDCYKKRVQWWKRVVTIPCYWLDLFCYRKLVDVLFLPDLKMKTYMKGLFISFDEVPFFSLPPGVSPNFKKIKKSKRELVLIYVGGIIPPLYDLNSLLTTLSEINNPQIKVELILCCRNEEWKEVKNLYSPLIKGYVKVYHKSSKELAVLYARSDVGILFFPPHIYRRFAMPVKLFEYISHGKPVIVNENTAVANFIKKNNIGWVLPYDSSKLVKLLYHLCNNRDEIKEKQKNIIKCALENTWTKRAEFVKKVLISIKI